MPTAKRKRAYGSGTVYYSESKQRWIGQYTIGTKPDGKPDKKTVYAKTEAECHKKLKTIIDEANKSQYVYVQKDTVSSFLNTWLTTVKKLQLKEKSYDRLEQTIIYSVNPYIGNIQLAALESKDVQFMIAELQKNGKSYSSIKKAYDSIHAAFNWALNCRPPMVKYNPANGVVLPSKNQFKPSDIKFYTAKEAATISETALKRYPNGTPWYPLGGLVVLAINTGLRIAELTALEWERDIDLTNKLLYVHNTIVIVKDRSKDAKKKYIIKDQDTTKTEAGQDRVVPLNDDAVLALETLKTVTGKYKYVFSTKDGNRKSLRDIDKIVRRVIIRAGFPKEKVYGAHALRHTFATLMLSNGVDIKIVSELLGHSNVSVTYNTYIHIIKEQKIKAISKLPNIVAINSNS